MDENQVSGLGRPLDPSYPSNLFIIVATVLSLIGFGLASYLDAVGLLESLWAGIRAALAVFLTWALTRELDPDHPASAVLAAIGQIPVIFFYESPGLLLSWWALFIFRVLNRSTGIKAKVPDTILVLGLSLWLGFYLSWLVPAVSFLVFLGDGLIEKPNRLHLTAAAFAAGELLYLWTFRITPEPVLLSLPYYVGLIAVSLAFSYVVLSSKEIASLGDITDEKLSGLRVQLAQIIALLFAVTFSLWYGSSGVLVINPVWLAIAASPLIVGYKGCRG